MLDGQQDYSHTQAVENCAEKSSAGCSEGFERLACVVTGGISTTAALTVDV